MSEKARDGHGRWRNLTIGFRLSPEENAQINYVGTKRHILWGYVVLLS